jgi:hypothetical protein
MAPKKETGVCKDYNVEKLAETSRTIQQSSAKATRRLNMDVSRLSGGKQKNKGGAGETRALQVRLDFS